MSIMWLVIGCIIPLTIAIFITRFLHIKKLEAKESSNGYYFKNGCLDDGAIYCHLIIGILLVAAIVFGVNNLQSIIQDIAFPEKTIIEFIRSYIQ